MTQSDNFEWAFTHVEKLLDRRQTTTSFYISINTVIIAAIGLITKDVQIVKEWMVIAVILLIIVGIIVCWIWRLLLLQYKVLLDWWYSELRSLEATTTNSPKLITKEFQELYAYQKGLHKGKVGMTDQEQLLIIILIILYIFFGLGMIIGNFRL